MEVSGQLHALATLPPGLDPPDTHWIGLVGPRGFLDAMEQKTFLPPPETDPGRPLRSRSLYRLGYPGSFINCYVREIISNFQF
jgi:hypothetical protein